jgi:GNAT superfamily N-acetyltransferase
VTASAIVRNKLTFVCETKKSFLQEAQAQLRLHWEEIAKNKELLWLNPNVSLYEKLADLGSVAVILAKDGDKIVGYFVWFLAKHPHYQHVLTAEEDVHFLLPEYRLGLNGYFLIKEAVAHAKKLGAKFIRVREKLGHERPAIMKRLGFTPTDITYTMAVLD